MDDEPAVVQLVCAILENSGLAVLTAGSGEDALSVLDSHKVNALLTEFQTPRVNGAELIVEARRRYPELPICIMTGGTSDLRLALRELIPVIQKPFSPELLIGTVMRAMNGPPETPSAIYQKSLEAEKEWLKAMAEFNELIAESPSGIPHPDGAMRIEIAGEKRKAAYQRYMLALKQYTNALKRPAKELMEGSGPDYSENTDPTS